MPGFEAGLSLLFDDALSLFGLLSTPQWGIYSGGGPIVIAESVIGFEYRQEWQLSDYPQEEGSFESYNKVQIPYAPRLRFVAGGSEASREALLSSIAAIAGDLNLYDAVSPEAIYTNVNVTHYDYRRIAQNGNWLLQVDVWLEQVQTAGDDSLSNASQPNGVPPAPNGTVQPYQPSASAVQMMNQGIL